jgi:hypothetical protein
MRRLGRDRNLVSVYPSTNEYFFNSSSYIVLLKGDERLCLINTAEKILD